MESNETLVLTLALCEKLDRKASIIYYNFSINEQDIKLKDYWEQMYREEQKHVSAWHYLSELALNGELKQIFDNPKEIIEDFEEILPDIDSFINESKKPIDIQKKFSIACAVELVMLNHSFINAFYLIDAIHGEGNASIADYDKHLMSLIYRLDEYGIYSQFNILVTVIKRLWKGTIAVVTIANEDSLTGLLNRKGFFQTITPLCYLALRNNHTVAVMFLDIDKFKLINDKYGHQTGDKILSFVAKQIKSSVRKSDIVCRYGGEEFIVFLPHSNKESLYAIGEKIRNRIQDESKNQIPVTVSIGIAYKNLIRNDNIEQEIDNLLKEADLNLYKAKESGRNRTFGSF